MKKEYVIRKIDASPDGLPYVVVSLSSAKDLQNPPQSSFDPASMGMGNMEDMMKNFNKMLSGMGAMGGGITSLKLDMHEYKEMGISVGDKVFLELSKAESLGI
jgi:hypothetical protein